MTTSIRMAVSNSSRSPGGNYLEQVVYVDGLVSMSQVAAQDTISHHDDVFALRYWGDDTSDDDLIAGPLTPTTTFAAPDGLHFERATALTHAQLDEDSGTFENIGDGGIDEIYVGARFLGRNGATISKAESNRIDGDF
jgi:hypothetical protein